MNFKIIFGGFVVICVLNVVNSANILGLFHFPSQSHHILGSALLKGLARKGHNVTMVSPFPFKEKIQNYTDIELKGMLEFKKENMEKSYVNSTSFGIMKNMLNVIPKITNLIIEQESMQNLLNSNSKFDAVIMFYPLSETLFGIPHHFNAPLILFTPMGTTFLTNKLAGNINPYAYVPNVVSTFSDSMTFKERVINTLLGFISEIINYCLFEPQQRSALKKHFPNAPSLEELRENVALTLVNSHYSTETPRPYTPNLIQIGGFHIDDPDPLTNDLQQYLDNAKEGVVYFSFGTNLKISMLPEDKINIMLKCLSKINAKVLWKFENDIKLEIPSNVRIEKWLPQKSILTHPNVKAFISHGGMGSVVESMHAGVPMIAIPFFGDQSKNVAEAVTKKYAISIEFNDLNEELLLNALDQILNNPIYRENVQKQSSLLNDQPVKPMDLAIYWVEHVIKHKGANHLKPMSTKLNIFQQLLLDVVGFIFIVSIVLIIIMYYLIKLICKLLCCRKKGEKNLLNKKNK